MKNIKKKLITLGTITALSGVSIYLLNKAISAASVRKNLLSPETESSYFKWQFGNIYYTKKGTGTPLLLIHDLNCSSSGYEWKYLVETLAKDHTVYCLDLLGCGRSDKPKITYTNYLYVQLITSFITHIIGCPADVIASSLSGSFVITACNHNPEAFRKIMLINPKDLAKLNRIPGKWSKFRKWMLDLPLIGTLLYHILVMRSNIELQFTEQYYYNPFHINSADIQVYYESAHRGKSAGKHLHSSIVGNYANLNITHALKQINNSIFIVGGAQETDIQETLALYTSLNTSIETVILPKAKHLPQLEAPADLLSQINIFF